MRIIFPKRLKDNIESARIIYIIENLFLGFFWEFNSNRMKCIFKKFHCIINMNVFYKQKKSTAFLLTKKNSLRLLEFQNTNFWPETQNVICEVKSVKRHIWKEMASDCLVEFWLAMICWKYVLNLNLNPTESRYIYSPWIDSWEFNEDPHSRLSEFIQVTPNFKHKAGG